MGFFDGHRLAAKFQKKERADHSVPMRVLIRARMAGKVSFEDLNNALTRYHPAKSVVPIAVPAVRVALWEDFHAPGQLSGVDDGPIANHDDCPGPVQLLLDPRAKLPGRGGWEDVAEIGLILELGCGDIGNLQELVDPIREVAFRDIFSFKQRGKKEQKTGS